MREGRVFLVGIEAANCAGFVDDVLGEQRADKGLADAAFGLQDEMNCVLHDVYTSLQKFGGNAARVIVKRRRPFVPLNLG